jgi:acylphosphatase
LTAERKVILVRMKGRVQGVWFRAWTVREASALMLDGWVRNRKDGSVEATFAGTPDAVDEILRRCHDGPPAARVDVVEVEEGVEDVAPGFVQAPTV